MAGFGSFEIVGRRRAGAYDEAAAELSDAELAALPTRFEAVGEALAARHNPDAACAVAGRALARDGASLGEALSGLGATFARLGRGEPTFAAAEALAVAWSEATLEYLHQLSCEDPLTGLATLSHVRTRLDEIYRGAAHAGTDVRTSYALVVVDAPALTSGPFARALLMARVAQAMRSVFSGGETVGRLGTDRAAAVVPRKDDLARCSALLRELLDDLRLEASRVRVWVEGLPGTADSAMRLLDELAR